MPKAKPKPAPPPAAAPAGMTWEEFAAQVEGVTDGAKLSKARQMLKAEKFQLYAEVHPGEVCGIVRSQSSGSRVYDCRLADTGKYSCCTQNLITCVVSRGSPCKHLLVLVVGLVKTGQLDPATALEWLRLAGKMGRTADGFKPDKDVVAAAFLKYKGAEAGEVDWRPTETIPEDFYAM
jgi:hypothetical protein